MAKEAGRSYWDVIYDKWFDTSRFPTRIPEVRAQGAIRADDCNASNHPWFG